VVARQLIPNLLILLDYADPAGWLSEAISDSTIIQVITRIWYEQPVAAPNDVVVTVRVADAEEYRIRLTDADAIATARKLLAGETAPHIPNGRVVRGEPDVNVGYSWHIDLASVEFADAATEVCDGRPSDVEKRVITSDRYCPWSAKVVAIVPVQDR
jgi:hypothetical protein